MTQTLSSSPTVMEFLRTMRQVNGTSKQWHEQTGHIAVGSRIVSTLPRVVSGCEWCLVWMICRGLVAALMASFNQSQTLLYQHPPPTAVTQVYRSIFPLTCCSPSMHQKLRPYNVDFLLDPWKLPINDSTLWCTVPLMKVGRTTRAFLPAHCSSGGAYKRSGQLSNLAKYFA